MCFRLGGLLYLNSILKNAEQKLKDNQAKVDFTCGDFANEESYWPLHPSHEQEKICLDSHCPQSLWMQKQEQNKELHVVSAVEPKPFREVDGQRQPGYYVDVKVESTQKPVVLALVSQSRMLWKLNFKKGAKVEKVLVISPDVVWLEGLPKDVPMTYFPKETLCAYPKAWEELANPENQFRRLHRALSTFTGLDITSFQGKDIATEFRVPFSTPLLHMVERDVASNKPSQLSLGLHWKREGKKIVSDSFQYLDKGESKKIEVPPRTTAAVFEPKSEKVFIVSGFQFGEWDWKKGEFKALKVPLGLPAMHWPIALAVNEKEQKILVYNDDRGGELFSLNPAENQWDLVAKNVGYSLMAMVVDPKTGELLATRLQGNKLVEILKLNKQGQVEKRMAFEKPMDFSKGYWHMQMVRDPGELWMKLIHPAHPGGDVYPMSQLKISM
ncbi:MAG: hypothetical protein KDD33_08930 [Bdellovibrionales bacterium]|nr:hypothetical protein [Bdellovibrionales bacterium]